MIRKMKFYNINLIDLLTKKIKSINLLKILKTIITSNIRLILSYNITVFLLGYSVFTPLFMRLLKKNFETTTAYCAPSTGTAAGSNVRDFFGTLFGSDSQIYNGYTLSEILVFGVTVGITLYTFGLIQEYAVPPLMRQAGFNNWYTDRELRNILASDVSQLKNDVTILRGENIAGLNNISAQLHRVHSDLTVNLNASRDVLVVLVNGLNTALSEITNENINPLHVHCHNLLAQMESMSNLLRSQTDQALSPTALRTELDRLVTLYNNEHTSISGNLQNILVGLQEQVNIMDPSDLNSANERLQSHIAFLESVLRQHAEGGSRVLEAVQSQIEIVDQQIEASQQLVPVNARTNNDSLTSSSNGSGLPPSRPSISATDMLAGTGASVLTQRDDILPDPLNNANTVNSQVTDLTALSSSNMGQYLLERHGDEIIIRLNLSGNVSIPVSEMAMNPATSQLTRAVTSSITNTVTDMVVSGALTASSSLVRGAFAGGLNGVLGSFGVAPIMRIMNNPSTQRMLSSDQVENFAKAADVGDTVGTGLGIAKSFVKNAWWVLKNS